MNVRKSGGSLGQRCYRYRTLYWSAAINAVVAVRIMAAMMLLAGNPAVMGPLTVRRKTCLFGWGAGALMLGAVLMMGCSGAVKSYECIGMCLTEDLGSSFYHQVASHLRARTL